MLRLDPSTGSVSLASVALPQHGEVTLVVQTRYSTISTGTEVGKVRLAGKPLWQKAQERPDQVAKVFDSVRSEGLVATAKKVRDRLAAPQPLGYSLSGIVLEVGEGCPEFTVGMAVACGGATANHAEVVAVPRNLVAPVPPGVPLQDACFATVGSVALHGLRTGEVSIGDRVLVIGLGLVGQLATRLCVAAGAHVFGIDPRIERAQLALDHGAERTDTALDQSTAQQVLDWSSGRGADVVLITAGGADNQPLLLAGSAARDRARVVVVGAIDLDVPREPFYEKELSLIVSRSYGPGRYDPAFEEKGLQYPVGFVPWTERRNMEEVLSQLETGRLSLEGLRGCRVPFERAAEGYDLLRGTAGPAPIAVVLEYSPPEQARVGIAGRPDLADRSTVIPPPEAQTFDPRPLNIAFIGLGNFASSYLLPAVKSVEGSNLSHVVTASPLKAEAAKRRAGFRTAGTVASPAIEAADTEVVFIATRHDSHARYVETALRAGRAVFVEKPLALTPEELRSIADIVRATQPRLMVGFNRRFAPATSWALESLGPNRADLRFLCRVNAGVLPHGHWLLDPEVGGGRLIGEACHFVDLACHFAASVPLEVRARALDANLHEFGAQSFHVEVAFENGASASIEYVSGGDKSLPKERIEVHRSGTSVVIDDFRSVAAYRAGKRRSKKWPSRDKGHRAEVRAFLEAVRSGAATPIPEEETLRSMAVTFAAVRSIRENRPIRREDW